MSNLSPDQFKGFNHAAEYAAAQGHSISRQERAMNPTEASERLLRSSPSSVPPTRWKQGRLEAHPMLNEN